MILQGEKLKFWENAITTFKNPILESVLSYRVHLLNLPTLEGGSVQQQVICLDEECPICKSLKKRPNDDKVPFRLSAYPTSRVDMLVYDINDELKVVSLNRKLFSAFTMVAAEKKNPLKFRYVILGRNLHGYNQYDIERAGKIPKADRNFPNPEIVLNDLPSVALVEALWMRSSQFHELLSKSA